MAGDSRGIRKSMLKLVLDRYRSAKSPYSNHDEIKCLKTILDNMASDFTTDEELFAILTILVESKIPQSSTFNSSGLIAEHHLNFLKKLYKTNWNQQDVCLYFYLKSEVRFIEPLLTSVDLLLCIKKMVSEKASKDSISKLADFLCNNPIYFNRLTEGKWKSYTVNDLIYCFHHLSGPTLIKFIMHFWVTHPVIRTVLQDPEISNNLILAARQSPDLENYSILSLSQLFCTADGYLRLFNDL